MSYSTGNISIGIFFPVSTTITFDCIACNIGIVYNFGGCLKRFFCCIFLVLRVRRDCDGREDAEDCDDDDELNEGEALFIELCVEKLIHFLTFYLSFN